MLKDVMHRYNLIDFSTRYDLSDHAMFEVAAAFSTAKDCWIAGGAVRSMVAGLPLTSDVDFFFKSEAAYLAFVRDFGGDNVTKSNFHSTFTRRIGEKDYLIQAVCIRYFDSAEDVIDSFDYTICQFALDGNDIVVGPYSLWDLARKRLVVHKVTYGAASVRRMLKYAKQGFTACQGCITALLADIAANPELIRSDVAYVD